MSHRSASGVLTTGWFVTVLAVTLATSCSGDETSAPATTSAAEPTATVEPEPVESRPAAGASDPSDPVEPTTPSDNAVIARFVSEFDATLVPDDPAACSRWFDAWAIRALDVQASTARVGDARIADAIASHQAATAAAIADCIESRPVDRESLAAEQRRVEEMLG